jgi:hypothetical protein
MYKKSNDISYEIIDKLKATEPNIQRKYFKKKVIEALKTEDALGISEFPLRVPDAYKICKFCRAIFIYEIDRYSPTIEKKLREYAELWFTLDYYEWDLILFVIDIHAIDYYVLSGEILKKEINLEKYFYLCIQTEQKQMLNVLDLKLEGSA